MNRMLVLALIGLAACRSAQAQRLPDSVIPESYDLTVEPNLVNATFSGEEIVRVAVRQPTTAITLNSAEQEFQYATITSSGTSQDATPTFDLKNEQATLTVAKPVPTGPADIRIHFTGILNDKLRGFYLSRTERRRYAITDLEATSARRAFPCFDEPSFKSVFHISLIVDRGDTAISNGKIISDTSGPSEGKHTLRFSPSPKMSTYLVAMLVGDFVCREGGADGIPIRVCAVPEKQEMTRYALEASENILKYDDKYYSIHYPFGKLDHIGIADLADGAMENTAAITYEENDLLLPENTASLSAQQQVTTTIAHEMAHQWFGDLVTMKWWNDIWLNEGFADWMELKALESWKPDWNLAQMAARKTLRALAVDATLAVRAVRADAETPAGIEALFDDIAYAKAGSVLRMVEGYVGPDVFQKGANDYLQKHAYANATAEDFWNQITEISGKPVDQIMKSFTEQSGAPLVTVKTACRGQKTEVTLKQEPYWADAAKMGADSDRIWSIPMNLLPSATGQPAYHLLNKKEEAFELPGCSEWLFADAGSRGYYRNSYDPAAFARMTSQIETSLSPEERERFPSDAWALLTVGRMDIGEYLSLLQKMQSEHSQEVMQLMIGHIPEIHDYLATRAERPAFEKWVRDFLRPIYADLGETPTTGEPAERIALRAEVLNSLAVYGRDPQLLARVRTMVRQYMQAPESVDASLARSWVRVAARVGDTALYDKYVDHLKAAKEPEESHLFLNALGDFPEPELTSRTFALVMGDQVKGQETFTLYAPLRNPDTQTVAWDLFKRDFPAIVKKIDAGEALRFVGVARLFCDVQLRDDSQQFFAEQKLPGSERILENAKDTVNSCIQMRQLQQKNLSDYLSK